MGEVLRTVQLLVLALCALAVVGQVWCLVRDRTPPRRLLDLMLGITLLLLVHLVVGVVRVVQDGAGVRVWEYVAYLVGVLLVVPVGVVWSSGERSRGGTGVLLVATLLVPFLFLRLADIWAAGT